ncbi:hypothetical protein CDAR_580391 [Caerostris darwini]|uniref:Uncharacterized protein n=1 Tax=Caerostris darwini TaxID=1538125 RepID=A0AAV4RF03_9ARAC|nr:hypothetical protein CDAR_580391 [Caerostris darwini]
MRPEPQRFPLLPSSSPVNVTFYCHHRLPLLLSPAAIVRLPSLSPSSSAAAPMRISKEIPFAISDRPSSNDEELLKIIQ